MPKLRVYLDTSVISHLFHDDVPEWKRATLEFFENTIAPRVHDCFISNVVIDELERTHDAALRERFLHTVAKYPLELLPLDQAEVTRMAEVYMERQILPSNKPEDAFHVAYATVFEMDALVTWNFRHLAKARTSALVNGVNRMEGYAKVLQLLTPLEVLEP